MAHFCSNADSACLSFFVLYCLCTYIDGQLCYGCVCITVVGIVHPSSMVVNINLYPTVYLLMYVLYDCTRDVLGHAVVVVEELLYSFSSMPL